MSFWYDHTKDRWRIRIRRRGIEFAETLPRHAGRAQAEERHALLTREHYNRTHLGRGGHTLHEALEKLIREALPARSAADILGHIQAMAPWVRDRPLTDIADVAREYRAEARRESRRKNPTSEQRAAAAARPLSVATLNRRVGILRRVANLAWREWAWLDRPIKISLPREHNERHVYYARQQIPALIKRCRLQQTRDMILIGAYSGLPEEKIYHLDPAAQLAGVRDERGRLIQAIDAGTRKNGERIYIPVHPKIRAALARAPFTRYGMRWIYRDYKRAAAAIGMGHATFHDVRHTAASWLINAGVDLRTVAEILGHRDTRTTARYAHLMLTAKRKAIARLK